MKLNIGMRCHDLCPKMEMERVFEEVRDNHIHQIQLAFSKSVSNYDFTTGHYSPGFARYIASELERN
ncbi:MAG: sugar phosphate isomerase/epimerase, partial [Clostridium sp.]|nr:sugar phosphate isomerase/epimerase [Clostridium sp.]